MDEADRLCDRIAIVDHGKLKALDSPLKLKASIPGKNVLEVSFAAAPEGWLERLRALPEVESVTGQDLVFRIASNGGPATTTGAAGHGGARGRHGALAVGPEHDARRRLRALRRPPAPRRAAGGGAVRQLLHHAARGRGSRHAPNLGHHRARAAALPAQPDPDGRVARLPRSCSSWSSATPSAASCRTSRSASSTRTGISRRCKLRELCGAIAANARTFETVEYADPGQALADLRNGRLNGVLTIPPEFSRRVLEKDDPRVALIEDNTDNFVAATLGATFDGLVGALNQQALALRAGSRPSSRSISSRSTPTSRTSSTCCPGRSCSRSS